MNDMKINNNEYNKLIFKNKRKVPSNDLAFSHGSNTILPFINTYDHNNSKSLNDYWTNKLNYSKIKEINQLGEITPPQKMKSVSISAVKNIQDNSICVSRNVVSPSPFNFPKIKGFSDIKNSRNNKEIRVCVRKESKEDSLNYSKYDDLRKMNELKENQNSTNNMKSESDLELVKKWLLKKEEEKKNEKIINHSNLGRKSFTENDNIKVKVKQTLSFKKVLKPLDESINYLKNILHNGDQQQSARKSFAIATGSTSENKHQKSNKKKDFLEPIKVLSSSKNPQKDKEEKILKIPTKPLNIKIKKNVPLNISKEKNIKIVKTNENLKNNDLKFNYVSKSKNGLNKTGNKKINQDSFLIKTSVLTLKDFSLFGVFDGHGSSGHLISNNVKENLGENFSKTEFYSLSSDISCNKIYSKIVENSYSLIKSTFISLDEEITNSKIDVKYSGSTANLIFLIDKKLICVNCGDSRATLTQKLEDKTKSNVPKSNNESNENGWYTIALSKDHKPEVEEEKIRIINNNGRVERYMNNEGPYRVWLKNEDTPGLAMSRSLGDSLAKTVGVISEPEIFECEINENSQFVVIASDGIWEFLTNDEVSSIVMPYYIKNDINGAVETLVDEAEQIWRQVKYLLSKEEDVIDDITALLIFFHK